MHKSGGLDERRAANALQAYRVLDTPREAEFDAIVHQAAAAAGTPMALISLVDHRRQWFKAKVGITVSETPLASSFCTHAIRGPGVFIVGDATQDARFARNPLVTGRPHIRFYAGAPLVLDGNRVGTLCVLDDQPRVALSDLQRSYLEHLSARAAAAITQRAGLPPA